MAFKPLDGSMEVLVQINFLKKKKVVIKKERLKSPDGHLCPLVKDHVLSFSLFSHHTLKKWTSGAVFSHCRIDMNLPVEDIEFVLSCTPTTCSQC